MVTRLSDFKDGITCEDARDQGKSMSLGQRGIRAVMYCVSPAFGR